MILESLSVSNFRNLEPDRVELHPSLNLFVGDNGQGKTSFLEAIYFLATTKSFRTTTVAHLIRREATNLYIEASVADEGIRRTLSVGIDLSGEGRRRLLQMNGQPSDVAQFVRLLPVIAYSSDRLAIVRGAPEERRRFLDRGISSIQPEHLRAIAKYARALKQRNALLSAIRERRAAVSSLDAWDVELATIGQQVVEARRNYATRLKTHFDSIVSEHQYHIGNLAIEYAPSGFAATIAEAVQQLRAQRPKEIAAGITLFGPHRDQLHLTTHGVPAAEILSSGETKTVVLFLKFAKLRICTEESSIRPLLLLDDIDAELDLGIVERLLAYASGSVQLFTTSPKGFLFDRMPLGEHLRLEVAGGRATKATNASE